MPKKALVSEVNAMEEAIKRNPTPELLEAYEKFFGKKIEVELPKKAKVGKIRVGKSKKVVDDDDHDDDFIEDEEDFEQELNNRLTKSRNSPSRSRRQKVEGKECSRTSFSPPKGKNLFEKIAGEVSSDPDVKEAAKIDKKYKINRMPRMRGAFSKVKVRCYKCREVSKVSPALLPPDVKRWVCNLCATGG